MLYTIWKQYSEVKWEKVLTSTGLLEEKVFNNQEFMKMYSILIITRKMQIKILFLLLSQVCPSLFDSMDWSMPGFPVLHYLLEFAQTHVFSVDDAIQPSQTLSPAYPPALNLSQHQGLSQWGDSLYQVTKVLELQLQHQSFQWLFRFDFL